MAKKIPETAQQNETYTDALRTLKERYQRAEQISAAENKIEDRKPRAQNPEEFCVGAETPPFIAPALCPNCSGAANIPAHILAYNYNYDAGTTILFGIVGQLFRFLLIGSSSKTLLTAVTCARCRRRSRLFKGLEWVCRVGGILMTGVLIVLNSTRELPLLQRGIGLLLLSLSPLPLGAILALTFRRLSDRNKGITYKRSEDNANWFRVRSAKWLHELTLQRENAVRDMLDIQQDGSVVNCVQTTLNAWSSGKLSGLSDSFKNNAYDVRVLDFFKKYPLYEGTSLRVFFKDYRPLEGEYIIGIGDDKNEKTGESSPWFVLTNVRLVQRDGGSDEFKEVILTDVCTYQLKQNITDTLMFKMKSGNEITFEKIQCRPSDRYLSWALSQSGVA